VRKTATSPRIAYDVIGNGGPRVLLVMGLGMRGKAWKPQLDDLGRDHSLAFFDHRGVGESEKPSLRRLSMDALADDVFRVLDELEWDRVHVVGVSMGGMVAQEVVLRSPSRFRSLSLFATHPGGPFGWIPTVRGLGHALAAVFSPRARRDERFARLLYTDEFLFALEPQRRRRYVEPSGNLTTDFGVLLAHAGAVRRFDSRQRLHALGLPTLIGRPAKDLLVPPSGSDALASLITGARLVRFDDAGHSITSQCVAAVNEALRTHIGEAEQRE